MQVVCGVLAQKTWGRVYHIPLVQVGCAQVEANPLDMGPPASNPRLDTGLQLACPYCLERYALGAGLAAKVNRAQSTHVQPESYVHACHSLPFTNVLTSSSLWAVARPTARSRTVQEARARLCQVCLALCAVALCKRDNGARNSSGLLAAQVYTALARRVGTKWARLREYAIMPVKTLLDHGPSAGATLKSTRSPVPWQG